MFAIDTSAVLAIPLDEAEGEAFKRLVAGRRTLVGAPTLVEAGLVLEGRLSATAEAVLRKFVATGDLTIVPFDAAIFEVAIGAFARFGKGRGHPAKLNFGDCMSYAVAKTHDVPLLFKGNDFIHTDLVPAYQAAP